MTEDILPQKLASWSIDVFRPGDAEGVVELYYHIYGDQYPVKTVYDPGELIRQSAGDAFRIVARTEAGEVVGHIALYRSTPPNLALYEQGQLMVRHDYRATDIAARLVSFATIETPAQYGLEQIWGEAVCNHLVTQQMTAKKGFFATALEVDLIPAQSYTKAFSQPIKNVGRVSALAVFRTFKTKPQTVYLPGVYEEALRLLYSAYDFGHTFVSSCRNIPEETLTRGKIDVFASAGVVRVTLFEIGQDLTAYLEQVHQKVVAEGAAIIQVFLPLSQPFVGVGVDVLRKNGYFLGGVMPRWFDDDGLFMQKLLIEPNFTGIHLYTKQAKLILNLIEKDWQTVSQPGQEADCGGPYA